MWLDYVQGKEGLDQLFGEIPYGCEIKLRRISFEDRSTTIEFDLIDWPEHVPAKWQEQKFNTIQVKLTLGACAEIVLKDWALLNVGEFRVKPVKTSELLSFKFVSKSGAYFSCICDALLITKVSSYQNA